MVRMELTGYVVFQSIPHCPEVDVAEVKSGDDEVKGRGGRGRSWWWRDGMGYGRV